MAEVHEASLEGHDGFVRKVALKRVRPELAADPELARMFSDEARLASHLHHANLVAVLDFGVHDGVPFQALELVVGASLESLHAACARDGLAIPEELAIHLTREIAHGLAYAHRAKDESGRALGLVHRDVSPSNVLVSEGGDVKLADFGIAFAKKREVETAHGVLRGKPSYMAPEQATKGTLDARTDVFALGCTLHFALTGKSPLEGDAVLMKLLVGEPAPLDPRLSEDLRALIARALSPDRRDRPSSAEAFAEELDAAYRKRSDRDGRAALRAWVAPLVKRVRAAPIAEAPQVASSREVALPFVRPPTTGSATAGTGANIEPPPPVRAWVLTGLGTLVIGLIALELWSLSHPPAAPTAEVATSSEVVTTMEAAEPEAEAVIVVEDQVDAVDDSRPGETDGPEPDGLEPEDTERDPLDDSAVRDSVGPSTDPMSESAAVPAATTSREREREAPAALGWARIVAGCDRARDGAVSVDGRSIGEHVPTARRLTAGTHEVRVETASGEQFDGTIEVTEFHTESRPAWFRACQ